MQKVVTITLNPALDLTGSLSELNKGFVNVVAESSLHPAGKGINVGKVLSQLGVTVSVTGFLGKENKALFVDYFKKNNLIDKFVKIDGATRTNVKLVTTDSVVTDINFPGFNITKTDIDSLETQIFSLAKTHTIFVIAGSVPPGFPLEKLQQWIKFLKENKKTVIFDSSKKSLIAGVTENPTYIKPNETELMQLADFYKINLDYNNINSIKNFCEFLMKKGIENIIISLGEKGMLWFSPNKTMQALPPLQEIKSTVGAGDSVVAGIAWGILNNWELPKTIKFAAALGADSVTRIGVGFEQSQLNKIYNQTKIVEI